MVPWATASDGGGSIRIPAALTGTFGLKVRMMPCGVMSCDVVCVLCDVMSCDVWCDVV